MIESNDKIEEYIQYYIIYAEQNWIFCTVLYPFPCLSVVSLQAFQTFRNLGPWRQLDLDLFEFHTFMLCWAWETVSGFLGIIWLEEPYINSW